MVMFVTRTNPDTAVHGEWVSTQFAWVSTQFSWVSTQFVTRTGATGVVIKCVGVPILIMLSLKGGVTTCQLLGSLYFFFFYVR